LAAYSTYAIGARLPAGAVPEALFWDTADPYRYLRIDRREGYDYAVFGGKDHKTGQETDTAKRYADLEKMLRGICPESVVAHRWSGQVIEPTDGLPYIGETAEGQFVATGFAGNGMTFGTIAAFMVRDAILGLTNPWRDLFSVERKKLSALWDYLKENKDYPYYLIKQRLSSAEGASMDDVGREQGKILRIDGKKVAVYRDGSGQVTKLSPVCTHMGCIVAWNPAEKTWDCPCHGSRFHPTGDVFAGPAEEGLESAS
jgi:Rieske Fe-S protein